MFAQPNFDFYSAKFMEFYDDMMNQKEYLAFNWFERLERMANKILNKKKFKKDYTLYSLYQDINLGLLNTREQKLYRQRQSEGYNLKNLFATFYYFKT